jgi:DNA-directed RNA polymerase subunit K/omega
MADEFRADEDDNVDEPEVEEEEEVELEGVDAEQIRTDAADLQKLYKQHPEIWIPYEDDVLVQLPTHAPGPVPEESESISLGLKELRHVDAAHRTYPFLTQYEKTKVLSFRASQIGHGAAPYIVVPKGVTDSYRIAKLELEAKRIPLIIKRPLPNGHYEVWKLADLVLL